MSETITFGTDGWRSVIAEHFTFANVERVAYAVGRHILATYMKSTDKPRVPVLIGYDTRFMAEHFADRAGRVLTAMGIEARLSSRDVPTPAIAWSVKLSPTAGALQITASHNPPEYCGIKYIPDFAGPATNDITEQIAAHLEGYPGEMELPGGELPRFDPVPPYLEALRERVDFQRIAASGVRVAYDALYSTSRGYLDKALIDAGIPVTVLHDWRDPLFGGGMPEPKGEYLTELIRVVTSERMDVGVATDGDADRFAVVDELGNYFRPNQLIALLTRHLVKNRGQKGTIVRTVATTHLLDRLAQLYGLDVVETPVGFKYIGEVMRQRMVLIGGEESGGVSVIGHIPEKDGILASLLLIELIACERKPLSQIWQDLLKEVGQSFVGRRADLNLNHKTQKALMQRLADSPLQAIAGEKVARVGRQDGLKLYIDDDNWMLIRPSGTEPLIRLYFEATSAERADRMVDDFKQQVDSILGDLNGGEPGIKGAVAGQRRAPRSGTPQLVE